MRLLTAFLISFCLFFAAPKPAAQAQAAGTETQSAQGLRSQVLDAVARQLTDHFKVSGTIVLELQRLWSPPLGNGTLECLITEYPQQLTSAMIVRIKVLSGGEPLTETSLVVRAQHLDDVWVARTALERERLFSVEDFEVRRVDLLRERNPVAATETNLDMVLTRPLPA